MGDKGNRLRKFFNAEGISYASVARELGINKNTIHKWMNKEDLPDKHIVRVSKHYPDIKEVFPEVDWKSLEVEGIKGSEISHLSVDAKQRLYHWQNRYLALMDRYNELLEKHTKFLEDNLGK